MIKKTYEFVSLNKRSILSFLIVGAIAAVINFGTFAIFWSKLHYSYQVAVSFSFALAVFFHFHANRYFTFKSHHIRIQTQLPKYLGMIVINYTITLLIMYLSIEIARLSPYIGNVIAIAATVGIGYTISRLWVFAIK